MMFVEIPSPYFHRVPELDWDVHSYQKTPETASRNISLKSGKNYTEFAKLLFCTEKIILSNKLSEQNGVKTRLLADLELREEVFDGT